MKTVALILLSVLLNINNSVAQRDETRIWYHDSNWVMLQIDSVEGMLDTLYFIANVKQEEGDFYAYYDTTLKDQLACHLYFHNDTSIITVFFRSGKTKYISKEFMSSPFYEVRWCSNGQLIREVVRKDSMRIVNYYCNGNRLNEFTIIHSLVDGEYLWWHENGKPSISGYFKRNIKDGNWIYFDKSGLVIRREHWKDGVLIE